MPRLPFETLQRLQLPMAEMISSRIRDAHDFFLGADYEVVSELPGEGDLVVVCRRAERGDALRALAGRSGRAVLVIAPNDGSLRPQTLRAIKANPDALVALFTTNDATAAERVFGVPLGVRTDKLRKMAYVRAATAERPRSGLAFANFAVTAERYGPTDGVPHIRESLAKQLEGAPWVDGETFSGPRTDAGATYSYYAEIARHRFVFSPPGTGPDCYRHWEALYLGAIPIVVRSPQMERFAALPILFTEDYTEITAGYLEERWAEMSAASYEIEDMLKSTHRTRFLEAIADLNRPRFLYLEPGDGSDERFQRVLRRSSRAELPGRIAEFPTAPIVHAASLTSTKPWGHGGEVELTPTDAGLELTAGTPKHGGIQQRILVMPGTTLLLRCVLDLPEEVESCSVSVRTGSARRELAARSVTETGQSEVRLSVPVSEDQVVIHIAFGDPDRSRRMTIVGLEAELRFGL